ncbi:unnamed protein product [Bursaphelenchus okinawaensis]|uniref:Uncharacterized protein n=1 Tax=Bursaphelenchus okinawaensis TaxID=465554 RepID=A0A811KQV8_9BILA|nr:unnamed protein product [Bursaphelenchus okinawaensis]CAG9109419.1 unnamed protein product [Bursaphelenchus okinawaensis]
MSESNVSSAAPPSSSGGGDRRSKMITIFKTAAFAFFFGGIFTMLGGMFYIFLTLIAMLVYYGRLIYWAIPAELPGREPKVEFFIDLSCCIACLVDVLIVFLLGGVGGVFMVFFGDLFLVVSLGVLSFLEFKKWKSG